jgi:hypothetical protein
MDSRRNKRDLHIVLYHIQHLKEVCLMRIKKPAAILAACLALSLFLSSTVLSAEQKSAIPALATLRLGNAERIVNAYMVEGDTYYSLQDLAGILSGTSKSFSIQWDAYKNEIALTSGGYYESSTKAAQEIFPKDAKPATAVITLDNRRIDLKGYSISGNNFYLLDDFSKALDFSITWNNDTATMKPFLHYDLTVDLWNAEEAVIPIPTTIPEDAIPSFLFYLCD